MKAKKLLFFNSILFLLILIIIFFIGIFAIKYFSAPQAVAQEEEEDVSPPLVYNIKVESVSNASSTITWETDELADSLINYGLNKDYGIARDPRFDKVEHKIIIEDLLPGMNYYFRITSTDSSGNQGI
ncbi:hypothetical protein DRH27_06210, partial [Candidatus Falkowbacteria bacterium]